jgi:hypothetical protein
MKDQILKTLIQKIPRIGLKICLFLCCGTCQNFLFNHEMKENCSMAATLRDVCDTRFIYDKAGYEYSLPKPILEGFLSGKAFDNPREYTADESFRLKADISEIYQKIMSVDPEHNREAIITAGAPGAGKTVLLHQDLERNAVLGRKFAYICPDDVCLRGQTRTYLNDISKGAEPKAAYNYWRPGSNAANHLCLANVIRDGLAFYFGTTASGPATSKFFDFLKKQSYHIKLLHVTAPPSVCWESISERDKSFVQTTAQDVREKALLLPQRINDFLALPEIDFYYRDAVFANAKLAATWVQNASASEKRGTLKIVSPELYESVKRVHNEAVAVLNKPELRWEATVEANSVVVK